jgi:spermidine synthase
MRRPLALLLTLLTGFSGLVYEVTWQKYLAILLGSDSEATAAVLGLFLGGLAVGYALFGHVARHLVARADAAQRPPRLLAAYGLVEAAIGAYALLFPDLFQALRSLSFVLPLASPGLGFARDVVLAGLLVAPPAVLMGATIPLLTQALARSLADATRFHALVYAVNTAGAFAGALAAGFWLVPALGLANVLYAMGVLNLSAGAVFLIIGWRARTALGAPEPAAAARVEGLVLFTAVALLVGFAMMALQTVLNRVGAVSFGSSQFTFSMVVAIFVLCIALGSFAVSALPRIPKGLLVLDLWALVIALYLLYPHLQDAPYWAHVLRSLFRDDPAGFYLFHFCAFASMLAVLGPPVVLSGAALPLIFHALRRDFGGLGDVAGRLYSWNTAGSLAGALLGGYALLYWIDLHHVYRLALAAVAIAAFLATARVLDLRPLRATALGLAPILAGVTLLSPWSPERLSVGLFRTRQPTPHTFEGPDRFFANLEGVRQVLFYRDDPSVSVAVHEWPTTDGGIDRAIITNGKSDGMVRSEYLTMGLIAVLPALLAEKAERAFVIGYGTGVTGAEFASLQTAKEVVVAEISPGVIEAAPYFDFANGGASKLPDVRIVQADAYRALLGSEGEFDVIASEPTNPWASGVEMLYSREFLTAARDRLAPGGVFGQWFHMYETDPETVALVLRTYASVFEHVSVWFGMGPDIMLIGLSDPDRALDIERLARRGPISRRRCVAARSRGCRSCLPTSCFPSASSTPRRCPGRCTRCCTRYSATSRPVPSSRARGEPSR